MAFELGYVQRGNSQAILLTDYRFLIRELNKIDPAIAKALKQNYRKIATPGQKAVQKGIKNKLPTSGIHRDDPKNVVSGFKPVVVPGRLTWGTGKPVKSVAIETKMPKAKSKGFNSIARLRVKSPAVAVADMAGSKGKYDRRARTLVYPYKTGERSHANRGQGRGMVGALDRRFGRGASRFVYPAFDSAAPSIQAAGQAEINAVVDWYNKYLARSVK